MRRLYLHIYIGVIATAILVTVVAFAIGKTFGPERNSVPTLVDGVGQLIGEKIPAANAPPGQLDGAHQIEVDEEGNLYLSEIRNDRTQMFRPKPDADPAKLIGRMVGRSTMK